MNHDEELIKQIIIEQKLDAIKKEVSPQLWNYITFVTKCCMKDYVEKLKKYDNRSSET